MRFAIFQKALSPPKPKKGLGNTYPAYADLTQQELRDSFTYYPPAASYVFPSDMDRTDRYEH
ncbi:hypothetical protein A2U01_0081869, partial [Trifolium medium]|nr:hypothetical protein [Trifolium medium]